MNINTVQKHESSKNNLRNRVIYIVYGIQIKLILVFLVPVCSIIILGYVSYMKASEALIQSYETSIKETLDMTGQYYIFSFHSIMSDMDVYYQDVNLQDYYAGRMAVSPTKEVQLYNSTLKLVKTKSWSDELIENIYIVSKDQKSMSTTKDLQEDSYSTFIETEQGKIAATDPGRYFVFGSEPNLDKLFSSDFEKYAIRIVRKFKDSDTFIIADINRKSFLETVNRLKLSKHSVLGIITEDGKELLAGYEENSTLSSSKKEVASETVFYGKDFYIEAQQSDISTTNRYVTYQGSDYMFAYTKLETAGAMISMLLPKSEITSKADEIKYITFILVIFTSILAVFIGSLIARYVSSTISYIAKQLKKVCFH